MSSAMKDAAGLSQSIEKRESVFNRAKSSTLDKISSLNRGVRRRAVALLLSPLNPRSEVDLAVFQTIPLEFLNRGDLSGAIWFIETVCKQKTIIDHTSVDQVYTYAITEIETCMVEEDMEEVEKLMSSLEALFDTMKKSALYEEIPEFYILLGRYEEWKNDLGQALDYYNTAIDYGSKDGHLRAVMMYEKLGDAEKSLQTLEAGYLQHADVRCLEETISLLCRQGNMALATTKYTELHYLQKGHTPSFLLFKGRIESDGDVIELEEIIVQYVKDGTFIPLESLRILSVECDTYITRELEKETAYLKQHLKKEFNPDTMREDAEIQMQSIQRRLWLLQIGTLTLGNEKYMPDYLVSLRTLGLEGAHHHKEILQDFFANFPSKEVERDMVKTTPKAGNTNASDRMRAANVFESIAIYTARAGELFYQPGFYHVQKSLIVPLLRDSTRIYDDLSPDDEMGYTTSLASLRSREDYYMSLRPMIRIIYEDTLAEFDGKYGIYYRKHIQSLTMDTENAGEKHLDALEQNPEVAFLFWVEMILRGRMNTTDPAGLDGLVEEYGINRLGKDKSLLLASLLYDICPEYAIDFLASVPKMLDLPEALYIVTKGLRNMEEKERNQWIRYLHQRIKESYISRGFFEHIRYIFDDILKNDSSHADMECMFLTRGNVYILKRNEANKSMMELRSVMNFRTAGDFDSIDGLTETSIAYESKGYHDMALAYLEQAFLQDNTFNSLTKILDCTFHAGRYDTMQEYIDHALRMGWQVGNYIIALNLGQGTIDTGFRQILAMIHTEEPLRDTPPGLMKVTENILYSILRPGKNTEYEDIDTLRVLASFIHVSMSSETAPKAGQNILNHWNHISHICDTYTGDELHDKIQNCLVPIIGVVELPTATLSDISAELINIHAQGSYIVLQDILKTKKANGVVDEIAQISQIIDEFCKLTSMLLQRFPDTEKQTMAWIEALGFESPTGPSYAMPSLLQ